jgi:hypothetical protein
MRISHKYKFIFFANPKTGSETVRKILDPYADIRPEYDFPIVSSSNPYYSHMPPIELKKVFLTKGLNFEEYFKFTMVRNPWARLVSLYEMIYGYKSNRKPSLSKKYIKHKIFFSYKKFFSIKPRFKEWLLTIDNKNRGAEGKTGLGSRESLLSKKNPFPNKGWRIYGSYSIDNYIMDESKNILVDRVIKLEDIEQQLIPILANLNLPEIENIKIPKVNTRNYKKYTEYYDEESIEIVKKLYEYDIVNFNYQFGD